MIFSSIRATIFGVINMKLTRRGKRLRALLIAALILGVIYLLNYYTTPKGCRVSLETMSQGCRDILYPH